MFFGVKDFDGINNNEQLLTTFEYNRNSNLSPERIGLVTIEKIEPVTLNGQKFFKYTGKAYFRKYATPEESFTDHARVFLLPRYAAVIAVKNNPELFFKALQDAGYAQSPIYAQELIKIYQMIAKFL
jgi:flagellar protein FlgJ